jgi:hypothetical protein
MIVWKPMKKAGFTQQDVIIASPDVRQDILGTAGLVMT